MAEPLSDFSKILELQEIKKAYEEQQERHRGELAEKDDEIARLRQAASHAPAESAAAPDAEQLRQVQERLNQQIQRVRQDYEAKIERLNARIRELSAAAGRPAATPAEPEKRGFFKR